MKRQSGRTLGCILEMLGRAVGNPGNWVRFDDHFDALDTVRAAIYNEQWIRSLADQLHLQMSVHRSRRDIKVKSTWKESEK